MTIRFHRDAEYEFDDAVRAYNRASAGLGDSFTSAVLTALAQIEQHPFVWQRTGSETGAYPLDRFPYIIVYRTLDDYIQVVAVAHTQRRPDYWRDRL